MVRMFLFTLGQSVDQHLRGECVGSTFTQGDCGSAFIMPNPIRTAAWSRWHLHCSG